MAGDLRKSIETCLNVHSAERGSNTPDFVLANYLVAALAAFDAATHEREKWYGVRLCPGTPIDPPAAAVGGARANSLQAHVCTHPVGEGICGAPLRYSPGRPPRCVRNPLHAEILRPESPPPAPALVEGHAAQQRLCSVQVSYERLVQWALRRADSLRGLIEHAARELGWPVAPGWATVALEELRDIAAAAPSWTEGHAAQLAQEIRCLQARNAALVAQCRESFEQRAQFAEYQTAADEIAAARRLFARAEARLAKVADPRPEAKRGTPVGDVERLRETAERRQN